MNLFKDYISKFDKNCFPPSFLANVGRQYNP